VAHLGGQDQGAQHLEMTSECAAAVAKSVGEDRELCMQLQQLKKAAAAAQTDPWVDGHHGMAARQPQAVSCRRSNTTRHVLGLCRADQRTRFRTQQQQQATSALDGGLFDSVGVNFDQRHATTLTHSRCRIGHHLVSCMLQMGGELRHLSLGAARRAGWRVGSPLAK
jgi:hypothetical protein